MKRWQVITIVLLLAGAAYMIVVFPPVSRVVTPIPNPTPASGPVTLLFTGDVMLSRSVGDLMAARNDWTWPFAHVASVTAAADLTFGNLETTISTHGLKTNCGYCFRADPRVALGLVKAGFDVMSVANNHVWDYGPQAFTDTLLALSTSDISYVGGGRDITEARGGVVRTVRGTRIGYLAYTDLLPATAQAGPGNPGVNRYDPARMIEDIAAVRARSDVVIVSFHSGQEYQMTHDSAQERTYRAAVDAGADLVVGSHPHVVQEIERYQSGWIAYSLGNFVFDQNFSPDTMRGLMLSVRLDGGKITEVVRVPIDISRQYQPSLAND